MRHSSTSYPTTVIRERKLLPLSAMFLCVVPLTALIILRRDLLVWLGEPGWLVLTIASALVFTLLAYRILNSVPLMRVTPLGIEFPRLIVAPMPWTEITRIQAATRRSQTGDIHDRLLVHLKNPQIISWRSSKWQKLLGDTPQVAIAVDIGASWPLRADDVRNLLLSAAKTYALDPSPQSPAPVHATKRRIAIAVIILLISVGAPVGLHLADFGPARQFSKGLTLFQNGDIAAALPMLENDARAGDPEAAYALATLYLNGDGVTRNTAMAAGWFLRAADAGHGAAAYNLGNAYRLGLGTPKDTAKALDWYRTAANGGSAIAAYTLGNIYRLGDGVRRDYAQAFAWLETAAQSGFAPAEHDLGRLYIEGVAAPRDLGIAERWLSRAAARGHAPARYELARLLLGGTTAQHRIGLSYLEQAAESGYAPAQRRLAAVFFKAEGDARNPITAYKWISLAERSWPAATRADLVREKARISGSLNKAEIDAAKSLIRAWRPTKTATQNNMPANW